MKKVINDKFQILFKQSFILFILLFILNSCREDDLKIQQNFPFEVQVLPIPSKIAENEKVEIRISLVTVSDFSGTTYSIRYFQYKGAGNLRYYNDPPYISNDEYLLSKKQFRLYYTSKSSQSHEFSIWIKDSFGNEKKIDFEFDNTN